MAMPMPTSRKRKLLNCDPLVLALSAGNVVLLLLLTCLLHYSVLVPGKPNKLVERKVTFHGGHPVGVKHGSCYCGNEDDYCMCNPSLAIDLVIFSGKDHLWMVRRKDTQQLAVMGGFVDIGESVEHAVHRELKEEMGLSMQNPPVLFGIFSDPRRDNRRHSASAVFAIHFDGSEVPSAADDAKAVERVPLSDIRVMSSQELFADHFTIINDYLRLLDGKKSSSDFVASKGDFAPDILRSICMPLDER
jgi:8-oxo-dGTP diphosphatase